VDPLAATPDEQQPRVDNAECGKVWLPTDGERWEAYLTCGEPPDIAFYCPS
jgi:hypothetical protein